jgi:hypothetical protein
MLGIPTPSVFVICLLQQPVTGMDRSKSMGAETYLSDLIFAQPVE